MSYTARQTPDGRGIVLGPDGLTWEDKVHDEFEGAVRHANALNEWTASRPTGEAPELLLDAFSFEVDDVAAPLLAAIDKFYRPERRLNYLAASLSL